MKINMHMHMHIECIDVENTFFFLVSNWLIDDGKKIHMKSLVMECIEKYWELHTCNCSMYSIRSKWFEPALKFRFNILKKDLSKNQEFRTIFLKHRLEKKTSIVKNKSIICWSQANFSFQRLCESFESD